MTTSNRTSVLLAVVCLLAGESMGFVNLNQPNKPFGTIAGSKLFSAEEAAVTTEATESPEAVTPSYNPAALKAYDEWRLQNAPIGEPAKEFDEAEFRAFEETFQKVEAESKYGPTSTAATSPVAETATPAPVSSSKTVPIPMYNSIGDYDVFNANTLPEINASQLKYPRVLLTTQSAINAGPPSRDIHRTDIETLVIDGKEHTFLKANGCRFQKWLSK